MDFSRKPTTLMLLLCVARKLTTLLTQKEKNEKEMRTDKPIKLPEEALSAGKAALGACNGNSHSRVQYQGQA